MDGYTASIIVVGYRFLIPLTILRWPLAGYLLSMVADASDAMVLQSATSWGLFSGSVGYSHWDKGLVTSGGWDTRSLSENAQGT